MDYEGLKGYFASLRAAFDDLTISRGIVVVERDYVACQTTITGTFVREFTRSPVGPLPPNGRRIVFELMNIFRYDEQGRLAEEWVQTDNRSRPRQLGAEGRRAAPEVTPALVCAIRALQHSREPWMERRWQAEATAMPARSAPLVAGVWRAVAPGLRPVVAA
jgi:predicted ester cyclase